MKSWKEEKSRKASQETRTLQESNKPYTSDYEIDNYIKAYKHAYRVFRVHLHSLYTQCCGPESDYRLGIGTFEEMAMEAFTDALEKFLDTAE